MSDEGCHSIDIFEHKSRQRALAVAGSWRVGHRLTDSTWQGAAALQTEASCYLVRKWNGDEGAVHGYFASRDARFKTLKEYETWSAKACAGCVNLTGHA